MEQTEREHELAEAFAEITRVLLAARDVQEALDTMCHWLVATVKGCEHAVVTLVHRDGFDSRASSDEVGPTVDAIQFELDEGPCVQSIREHMTLVVEDLAAETRWPNFSRRAADITEVRSMLAFRLFLSQETLGSLNLYSKQVGAFDEDSVAVGTIFATHAAVALRAAQDKADLAQLRQRIEARDLIAQAKGILMGRQGISAPAALEILCRGAERLKIELPDLARRVIAGEDAKRNRGMAS
ncbi:MAG: GAF and ANTAR domain-containing protein [Actinomycetota bacterium]|nr:GAF and ANTAR domain-containing protein [Actinomycetota bacterium]